MRYALVRDVSQAILCHGAAVSQPRHRRSSNACHHPELAQARRDAPVNHSDGMWPQV